MIEFPEVKERNLVVLNLALGSFAGVANAAALAVVLTGGSQSLAGRAGEMLAWAAAGLILAGSAAYALLRPQMLRVVLQAQSYLVVTFLLLLAMWALSLVAGIADRGPNVIWSVGFLSALGFYCAVLLRNVFPSVRQPLLIEIAGVAIAIDLMAFWSFKP